MFFNYLFTGTTIYNYGSSQTEILILEESTIFKIIDDGIETEVLINSTANGFKVSIGGIEAEILINSTANGIKVYKGSSESYINISEESTVFKLIDVGIEAEILIDPQIRLIYTSWRKIKDNKPNWQIIDKQLSD